MASLVCGSVFLWAPACFYSVFLRLTVVYLSAAHGARLLFYINKVRDEVELVLTQEQFWELLNPVQTQLQHQRCQNLLIYEVYVHILSQHHTWPTLTHVLHAGQLAWPYSVLGPVGQVMALDRPQWMSVVLGVEFLEVHGGHELLGGEPTGVVLLLGVLGLRLGVLLLHVVVLLLLLMWLLLLMLLVIHHLVHLVVVSSHLCSADLAIHLTAHPSRPHHPQTGPLPHGGLHGGLRHPAVVHDLAVGKGAEAGLRHGVLWRATHSPHPVAVEGRRRAVGHGHHHVVCHGFSVTQLNGPALKFSRSLSATGSPFLLPKAMRQIHVFHRIKTIGAL